MSELPQRGVELEIRTFPRPSEPSEVLEREARRLLVATSSNGSIGPAGLLRHIEEDPEFRNVRPFSVEVVGRAITLRDSGVDIHGLREAEEMDRFERANRCRSFVRQALLEDPSISQERLLDRVREELGMVLTHGSFRVQYWFQIRKDLKEAGGAIPRKDMLAEIGPPLARPRARRGVPHPAERASDGEGSTLDGHLIGSSNSEKQRTNLADVAAGEASATEREWEERGRPEGGPRTLSITGPTGTFEAIELDDGRFRIRANVVLGFEAADQIGGYLWPFLVRGVER